ncbi:hypothetical protein LSH36_778g00035 [Paralvinella palmiformis]|uniref:Uncharacterized protein n=1 Tax=Paralvinella palmiformis TaxID=53620 RepID=A0AAD9MSI7_9ANNE|nr:hypothetical protein LSH36_778g00035 [Paralvinella palmiformis]
MYWIESKPLIQRSNLNGTDIKELVTSIGFPLVMALDPLKGRMYWADGSNGHIMSSDMDGQNSHEMFMNVLNPLAMALYDIILICESMGILEVDVSMEGDLGRKIGLVSHMKTTGVAFDSKDDKVYFINYNNGDIMTVFRNNSELKLLTNGTGTMDGDRNLALSLDTNEIFWTNSNEDCISRMTLSGENKTCISVTANYPTGIALDVENRLVYWTEYATDGAIKRSSYRGDKQVTLVSNLQYPYGISIDFEKNLIYCSRNDYKITVALLNNGTKVGTIQVSGDQNKVMTIIGKSYRDSVSSIGRILRHDCVTNHHSVIPILLGVVSIHQHKPYSFIQFLKCSIEKSRLQLES